VGALSDPDLGPVMAIGLGGRQAGLGRTAAFRLLLVTDMEAGELIDASESAATQLDGFRGQPALNRDAVRGAHPALLASAARGSRDRRSRPQPRPLHDERLHRPRHATTHPAPPAQGADQNLVISTVIQNVGAGAQLSCRFGAAVMRAGEGIDDPETEPRPPPSPRPADLGPVAPSAAHTRRCGFLVADSLVRLGRTLP
jgi:ATP-grasp domain